MTSSFTVNAPASNFTTSRPRSLKKLPSFAPMPTWQRLGALAVFALNILPDLATNMTGAAIAMVVFGTNFLGRAVERHGEARIDQADQAEEERILAEIMDERHEIAPGEAQAYWRWMAWGVVAMVAVTFQWSGSVFLQAREPLLWTLAMALVSVLASLGIVLACNRSLNLSPAVQAHRD